MSAITFPSSPSVGQQYTAENGQLYTWTGVKWQASSGAGGGSFNGDYNSLINTPTIPSTTSDLTNNSGFITSDVDQSIVPTTDNAVDLGSPTNRFRHLYVAPGTIYLGDIKLTNLNGKLAAKKVVNPGEENEEEDNEDSDAFSEVRGGGGNANTGDFTFSGATMAVAPHTMYISAGSSTVEFLGYIDNGMGGDSGATLHVTSIISGTITDGMTIYGSTLPEEGWTLTFGTVLGDQGTGGVGNYYLAGANYLTEETTFTGEGSKDAQTWTFDGNGKITLPNGGDIVDGSGNSVLGGGGGNANTGNIQFEDTTLTSPNGNGPWYNGVITLAPGAQGSNDYGNNGQFINIYPTWDFDAPHIHIAAGTGENGTGDLILGPDGHHIDINHDGKVYVKTNNQTKTWAFDDTGAITFPDGTVQTTAYVTGQQYGYINQFIHSTTQNVDMEAVAMDSDGNSYVSYSYYDENQSKRFGGIVKLNSTGAVQWNTNLQSSTSSNPEYPQIYSLEYTSINGMASLVTIGTYYDNDISKDRGFMWFINPSDGSVGSMFDTETSADVAVTLRDAVFGLDGEGAPYAVLVGNTYNEIIPKSFTPLAGSGVDRLVVSWAEFNASNIQTGEWIYYTQSGNYGIRFNSFDTVATPDGTGGGLWLQVGINQDGTYSILRANGWSWEVNNWGNPANIKVLGSNLGGVDGVNDLTFDFDVNALNNNSGNIAGWASNIQGTPVGDCVGLGWGSKDWSTEIGNTLTFDYQLNSQAYLARLGNNAWGKSIGATEYEQLNTVVVDGSGNSYVGGYYWNGSKGSLVAKYDIGGNAQWAVLIDSLNDTGNHVTSIDLLSDGNIIVVDEGGFVTKLDSSNGSIIWQVRVDPNNDISWDSDFKGTATPDGNYIFTNYEDNNYTLYVLCVSGVDGSEIWSKRISRVFGGSNGEIDIQDDYNAQCIDCNATSVTVAGGTYLYFNNNSTNAGLIINFPITGENTDGVYGQYIIETVTPGWNVEENSSIGASINSMSSLVTTSSGGPSVSSNTFTMTETAIGEAAATTVAGIERHSASEGDNNITLAEEHNGKFLYYNGSNGNSWIYVPSNSDVNLPVGFTVTVVMDYFNGNRVYVNNNTGSQNATINASGFDYNTSNYWMFGASASKCGVYTIMKVDTDRWMLAGPDITVD